MALHLFLAATPKTAMHSRVRNTPTPQCPLDLRVDTLLGEVEDVIDRIDGLRIADLIHQPEMKFIIWIGDSREACELDGCRRALDVSRIHAKVNKVLGFEIVWQRRIAPCPSCGERSLGNWTGDSEVRCEKCILVIPIEEYNEYCMELLKERRNAKEKTYPVGAFNGGN